MRTSKVLHIATVLISAILMQACSGPGLQMQQIPENGYYHSSDFQFQAQVVSDSEGRCQRITVHVKPLNKLYSRNPPPDRLQLFDDDCDRPFQFERIRYVGSSGSGGWLSGFEISRFWAGQLDLQEELLRWLLRELNK